MPALLPPPPAPSLQPQNLPVCKAAYASGKNTGMDFRESLRSGLNYSLSHSLFGLGELPNLAEPLFLFYKMKIHKIKKT